MRFVAVKSEEQQAAAIVFRVRDLVVRQRTRLLMCRSFHLIGRLAFENGPYCLSDRIRQRSFSPSPAGPCQGRSASVSGRSASGPDVGAVHCNF